MSLNKKEWSGKIGMQELGMSKNGSITSVYIALAVVHARV
jgi:hypothetical protein